MADPSFVAVGTIASAASQVGTAGLITDMPTHSEGDLLIWRSSRRGAIGVFDTISGWTNINVFIKTEVDQDDQQSFFAFRFASASEPSSYTLTHTDTVGKAWSACICSYADVASSGDGGPFDVTPNGTTHFIRSLNDSISPPSPTITTVTNGALTTVTLMATRGDLSVIGAPTGYASRVALIAADRNLGVADNTVVTAGLEDPGDWNNTSSAAGPTDTMCFILALKPSVAVVGGDLLLTNRSIANYGGIRQ